ncbi:XRE family transcriptional regulator [Actinomadura miaoliensis]
MHEMARQLREAVGITEHPTRMVKNMARQILRWEKGDHFPRDWADAYATVFTTSVEELFGDAVEEAQPLPSGAEEPPSSLVDLLSLAWMVGTLDQSMDRRTVLQLAATLATAPALGVADPISRLAGALTRPTGLSDDVVSHLEARTVGFHRLEFVLPAAQIFRGLLAHLNEITSALEGGARDRWRTRLARAAGESAVLGAWLAWDLGDVTRAASLYHVAELAAREGEDPAINACAAIYQSFATSAVGDHATARRTLANAHQCLREKTDRATRAWLIGREAEEAAALGDPIARDMIEEATDLLASARPQDERSWTRCLESPHLSHMRLTIATRLRDETAVYDGVGQLALLASDPAQKKTGRMLASIGLALVKVGDVEEGVRFGERSIDAVRASKATYAMNRLAELDAALRDQVDPRARELRDGIRATHLELASPPPSIPGTTPGQR